MKEALDNRGANSYLVYELQPEDRLEGQSLRALAGNKIQSVAPAAFSQVGTTKYIRYDVSGKISMTQLLSGAVGKQVFLGVFGGMVRAMESINDNQVDPATVLLDPDHVFTNPTTGETVMVCLPLIRAPQPGITLATLCNYFAQYARLNTGEDTSYAAGIHKYLSANPVVSLSEMKEVLNRAAVTATGIPAMGPVNFAPPVTPVVPVPPVTPAPPVTPVAPVHNVPPVNSGVPQMPDSMRQMMNHGGHSRGPAPDPADTVVMDNRTDTVNMSGSMGRGPAGPAYLIRYRNGERIVLNKPVFRIGKERSYVDYFVSDNPAVSRAHADIIFKNGEYFIVDTRSTNHTYINGGMIPPHVETRLSHGAKIRLGNEDFEFHRY